MTFLGIPMQRPSLADIVLALVIAVGAWVALETFASRPDQPLISLTRLCTLLWGTLAAACGISIRNGWRPLAILMGGAGLVAGLVYGIGSMAGYA